jgi:hypothetical protein
MPEPLHTGQLSYRRRRQVPQVLKVLVAAIAAWGLVIGILVIL